MANKPDEIKQKKQPTVKKTVKKAKPKVKPIEQKAVEEPIIKGKVKTQHINMQSKKKIFSDFWKKPLIYWTIIILLFAYIIIMMSINNPQSQNDLMKDSLSQINQVSTKPLTNEQILIKHVETLFKTTYSPYYNIEKFITDTTTIKENNKSIELEAFLTMHYKNYYKDPDTVGYIAEAKQNSPLEYEKLYEDYNSEKTGTYKLKITADLKNSKVVTDSIKVLFDQGVGKDTDFIDVNLIFPNKQ